MREDCELDKIARAHDELIATLDGARLTAEEIRHIAVSIGSLKKGHDFRIVILSEGSPRIKRTIAISY